MLTGVNRVSSGACQPLLPSQALGISKQLYKTEFSFN